MADDQDPFAKYAKPTTAAPADDPFAKYRTPAQVSGALPDPPSDADPSLGPVEAFEQGAVLDPLESVGQMAENLPDWAGGGLARRAGAAIMSHPGIRKYLEESKAGAEAHPGWRMAGGLVPWMFVPGAGETAVARGLTDVGIGAASGVLQPEKDSTSPDFWTDKAREGGISGVLGGAFGAAGRYLAGGLQRAAQRTAEATKATREAVQANIRATGETNIANQAGQAAHAQATTDAAKATAKAAADYHSKIASQASALADFVGRAAGHADRTAKAAQQHASDLGEHILNEAKLQQEYEASKKAFDAEMARRGALDRDQNVTWMRRALDKVGLGGRTPTEPGNEALNATREMITGELNKANSQLSFDPADRGIIENLRELGHEMRRGNYQKDVLPLLSKDSYEKWKSLMTNVVLTPIAKIHVNDEGHISWEPKLTLTGEEFAKYVSRIRGQADNLARNAKFGNPSWADDLKMSDQLDAIADAVEGHADGPQEAKDLRDNAREAYAIYGHLSRAAEPENESVAKSDGMVREIERRLGTDNYRKAAVDPKHPVHESAKQAADWRHQARMEPPDKPELVTEKPPVAPKVTPGPKPPKGVGTTIPPPKVTKPPDPFVPAQPKLVDVPPVRPTVGQALGQAGRLVGHAVAHKVAPGVAGHILAPTLGDVASHAARRAGPGVLGRAVRSTGRELSRDIQTIGRRPGVAARSPDIVIQSITSGSGGNDASQDF